MRIVWDESKRVANFAKHGIDFADVATEFDFRAAIVTTARDGRFKAIAGFRGRIIVVIFRALGTEALSLVSARPASRRERSPL